MKFKIEMILNTNINSILMATMNGMLKSILTAIKLYFFWTIMHWGSIQVYQSLCVPKTPMGFFLTPIMTQAPHCKSLLWCQQASANAFNSGASLFITWTIGIINTNFSTNNLKVV